LLALPILLAREARPAAMSPVVEELAPHIRPDFPLDDLAAVRALNLEPFAIAAAVTSL
jgi:hypothetical protein